MFFIFWRYGLSYADAFKSLRHAYKLTQVEFAKLLQVSKPTIQKLEAGSYMPSEKMAARLVELFRSDRFKNEFKPRVNAGDLRSVGVAFGNLLDLVYAEEEASAASVPVDNSGGVYADIKKDYAEFQAMVRSQQETIRNLSESNKNLAESIKHLAENNTVKPRR